MRLKRDLYKEHIIYQWNQNLKLNNSTKFQILIFHERKWGTIHIQKKEYMYFIKMLEKLTTL
jgi:hypothetical protein